MSGKPDSVPSPADFFNWMNQFVQPLMEAGAKMATPPPATSDTAPGEFWKDLQARNEQAWTQFMAQVVATPEFAANLGKAASSQATYKNNVRKTAQLYLETANMPSRDDTTRLAALLVGLDAKLDDLNDRWDKAEVEHLSASLKEVSTHLANIQLRFDKLEARLDHDDSAGTAAKPVTAGRRPRPHRPAEKVIKRNEN